MWVGVSAEGAYSHEVGPLDLTPALVVLFDFTLNKPPPPQDINPACVSHFAIRRHFRLIKQQLMELGREWQKRGKRNIEDMRKYEVCAHGKV